MTDGQRKHKQQQKKFSSARFLSHWAEMSDGTYFPFHTLHFFLLRALKHVSNFLISHAWNLKFFHLLLMFLRDEKSWNSLHFHRSDIWKTDREKRVRKMKWSDFNSQPFPCHIPSYHKELYFSHFFRFRTSEKFTFHYSKQNICIKKAENFFFTFFALMWTENSFMFLKATSATMTRERENFIVRSNVEKKVWRKEWKRFFYALKDSLHAKGGNEREERSA